MRGRYYSFCIVVRVNQIEVAPGINLGKDERFSNTVADLERYRKAIYDAIPEAKITIAFSHEALLDDSEEFASLREKARQYHLNYGDDITYMLGAYFSGAYSPREAICGHVDAALELIKDFMGKDYLPLSIVGGFVPARVIEHVASLGIHTVQGIIFSQYAIDNQDGDGSICYPYYPSKEHFCKPAQNEDDFIDAVILDGWTVDFINATYSGIKEINGEVCNSRMGCGPIETFGAFEEGVALDIMLKSAAQMLDESYESNGNFGFATAIWELCLIHDNFCVNENMIFRFLSELKKAYPDVKVVPFGQIGDEFRRAHKDNSDVSYVFTHKGIGAYGSASDVQIQWYMNTLFRLAIKTDLNTGKRTVIDFTDYTKKACEPPDSDYHKGIIQRNWSLLGDINQKGLRKQDAPVAPEDLTKAQKELIALAEKKFGIKIL